MARSHTPPTCPRAAAQLPGRDLDARLSPAERADLEAYAALLTGPLADALAWCYWSEARAAAGAGSWRAFPDAMLAPLRWFVPKRLQWR